MSTERDRSGENFLSRWSRLKTTPAESAPPAVATDAIPDVRSSEDEPPLLPPVEELTIDSDFRGFLHPKVDENVRRAALRKLFSDPQFNVMDGLDVYIDDYSKADPIPPEMLAGLKQAQKIFRWAEGKEDEPEHEAEDKPPASSAAAAEEEPPVLIANPEPPQQDATALTPAAAETTLVTQHNHKDDRPD